MPAESISISRPTRSGSVRRDRDRDAAAVRVARSGGRAGPPRAGRGNGSRSGRRRRCPMPPEGVALPEPGQVERDQVGRALERGQDRRDRLDVGAPAVQNHDRQVARRRGRAPSASRSGPVAPRSGRSGRPLVSRGRACGCEYEDRHRWHAERGEVLAVQRAHARRSAGGELPVHDRRAERGGGGRPGRAPGAGGRDGGRAAGRARDDPVPRHRRARARRAPGRGARQQVPREHPRDRRDPARGPGRTTTRRWCTRRGAWTRSPTSRRSRRSCCSPTWSRPSGAWSGCRSRRSRSTRCAVAEERWLRRVVEALRAGRAVRTVPEPDDAPGASTRLSR